jgi:hypothetical protein
MMYVQSGEAFNQGAEYDHESRCLLEKDGLALNHRLLGRPPDGHYAYLGGVLVVLYRHGGGLWLRLGEQVRDMESGQSEARWVKVGKGARLVLLDKAAEVAAVEYEPEPEIEDDPTPFREAEDGDFGLFVANVLSDDLRRKRMYVADLAD